MAWANARHPFLLLALFICFSATAHGELSYTYYDNACGAGTSGNLPGIVSKVLANKLSTDPRMGASLLRLFFHDCFPQGCDASVLLVDNATRGIDSEQNASPNKNSLRGFDVIDAIKTAIVSQTNCSVSCADILAVTAREAVIILGGPSWKVRLGRLDSLQAFRSKAESDLPGPSFTLQQLKDAFSNKKFNASEMVALSGGHAIGKARCQFEGNAGLVVQANCTALTMINPNSTLIPLDTTPNAFDNQYYRDLVDGNGVLNSDRVLVGEGSDVAGQVQGYSTNTTRFFEAFANAMAKMSEMNVLLTGSKGEIRRDCKSPN